MRIIPNIFGRLSKPGKLFSKVKVLSVLDHPIVKIPAIKAFEFENMENPLIVSRLSQLRTMMLMTGTSHTW